MNKILLLLSAAALALAARAYLPPADERDGVKVEIGSFPQKTERPGNNPYAWPLGVTEVAAGAPRAFPVTVANASGKPVRGRLEVWMNDDWDVSGEAGEIELPPDGQIVRTFTGTARPRALDALYPVHARFTPAGARAEDAPHAIAVFRFANPGAPRSVPPAARAPRLGRGSFRLDAPCFARTTALEVGGARHDLPESGDAGAWGGGMTRGTLHAGGVPRDGFHSHPPYKKGAGFLWSDFPLELPDVRPIRFRCWNFLVSPGAAPASDGAEYKVFVVEEGRAPQEVAGHVVKDVLAWRALAADLSPWAGKKIALRLWTGPGPAMNTTCDGGGWGDPELLVGEGFTPPAEADLAARARRAEEAARAALAQGTDAAAGRWLLEAGGERYGAGAAYGARGLADGALAFTDGARCVVYRGFEARVETADGGAAPDAAAAVSAEGGVLRVKWSIPGATRDARGFPRIAALSVGPASERPARVYFGFGNVIEGPRRFAVEANGFTLSTRHAGADYANGLSVVHAVDVPPDGIACDGEAGLFSIRAHHDATFTFVPSARGAFDAARRFRAASGYRASPGLARLGARMCLDQWGGDYARAARDLDRAAKYGLSDCVFVKHDWQRWGYDYRLPEIYPPRGDAAAFAEMREACRRAGILFCPHDNYTDIYPDCDGFSYDLVVFNLDGTPQKAWFNAWRHALSYRWAPHRYLPWCARNARLLKEGCDPDGVFIDVFTAHGPFDYLDREGNFHDKMETSARWGEGFAAYRRAFGRPDAVCLSEAGQDHLTGVADGGQSDHFTAAKIVGAANFADAERAPWHDIVTHGRYVLFAGGLGGRYQEEQWNTGGDAGLHGYASDDYLSNAVLGGRNPMCDGPFSPNAVRTYWMQHDACAELARAEFLAHAFGPDIHCQHTTFSDGGEVWANRRTNGVWRVAGVTLPPYGYYAKTRGTESGIVEKDGVRCAFAKSRELDFYDARKPPRGKGGGEATARDRLLGVNRAGAAVDFGGVKTDGTFRLARPRAGDWTLTPLPGADAFAASLDLAALGAPAGAAVAAVEAVEPEAGASAPEWRQDGGTLALEADARAFAYRIRFAR